MYFVSLLKMVWLSKLNQLGQNHSKTCGGELSAQHPCLEPAWVRASNKPQLLAEDSWHSTLGYMSNNILDTRNHQWLPYKTLVNKSAIFFLLGTWATRASLMTTTWHSAWWQIALISSWWLTKVYLHWWQPTCCPHKCMSVLSEGCPSYRACSKCPISQFHVS